MNSALAVLLCTSPTFRLSFSFSVLSNKVLMNTLRELNRQKGPKWEKEVIVLICRGSRCSCSVPCMLPPPAVLSLEPGNDLTFPGRIQVANAPTPREAKGGEG